MLLAELFSSEPLDSSEIDGIRICCEVMIPEIFSTKNRPWTSDDVYFADEDVFAEPTEAIGGKPIDGGPPVIAVEITTLYSNGLSKEREQRTLEMVAALQEVVSKDYRIFVTLKLVAEVQTSSSDDEKIPDIVNDQRLKDLLDTVLERIVCEDELIADPATRESMQYATDALVADSDKELASTQ